MRRLSLLVLLALVTAPASADVFGSISNAINSATNTVSNGLNTATNAVSSGVGTAVNATSNGLDVAANATKQGIDTALNTTGKWINTAVSSVKDAYNVSAATATALTHDVQTALAPAASDLGHTVDSLGDSIYNVTTGTYHGVVQYGKQATGSNTTASNSTAATQNTTVDATNATSVINAITTNSSGFVSVANSLLVALGQQKSSAVESGIANVVNNQTGNSSYPAQGPTQEMSLGLAEAVVTALVTANNYSVTVEYNGNSNSVNASEVADVFLAGLQDAVTPCAMNVSSTTNATSGSDAYFEDIATGCCYLVSQPLTYADALSQSNGVGTDFEDALQSSQLLGQSPSLDLTRCLTNQPTT